MGKPLSARLTVKIVLVSVADALRLRKTCHFPLQREIRDRNVRRLGLEMEKGRFIQGTPVFFCVLPDGTQYIVNGNHTLEAVSYSGKPQTLVFIFLQVDTFAEAAAVYTSFDVHKARTWTDALRATGKDQMPLASRVASAVKLIMSDFKYSPENVEANSSRASRFDAMDEYETAAGMLQDAIKGAPNLNQRIILRSAVMAVALETIRYQPSNGFEFWHAVAQDEGLVSGDARKALLRWLLSHPASKGSATYLMSRACAHAWNAWWKNQSITVLRPSSAGKIVLLGTPWDGKRGGDGGGDGGFPDKGPTDDAPSVLPDIFETGMRVTDGQLQEVVMHKSAEGQ